MQKLEVAQTHKGHGSRNLPCQVKSNKQGQAQDAFGSAGVLVRLEVHLHQEQRHNDGVLGKKGKGDQRNEKRNVVWFNSLRHFVTESEKEILNSRMRRSYFCG